MKQLLGALVVTESIVDKYIYTVHTADCNWRLCRGHDIFYKTCDDAQRYCFCDEGFVLSRDFASVVLKSRTGEHAVQGLRPIVADQQTSVNGQPPSNAKKRICSPRNHGDLLKRIPKFQTLKTSMSPIRTYGFNPIAEYYSGQEVTECSGLIRPKTLVERFLVTKTRIYSSKQSIVTRPLSRSKSGRHSVGATIKAIEKKFVPQINNKQVKDFWITE